MQKGHILRLLWMAITALCFTLFFIIIPEEAFSQTRLKVESTIGTPGSSGNKVIIGLENPYDKVSRIRFDICDADNYLTLKGVIPSSRTEKLHSIEFKELPGGSARVIVSSAGGGIIEKGKGPVLTLMYEVSKESPLTEHRSLNLKNINIEDDKSKSVDVTPVHGVFIFIMVQGKIIRAEPEKIIASQTKPTTHFLLIIGEDTRFNLSSKFYFNPRDEIDCLGQIGFGNYTACVIRLNANPPTGLCDIGIYTDGGKAVVNGSDVFEVVLPYDKGVNRNDR